MCDEADLRRAKLKRKRRRRPSPFAKEFKLFFIVFIFSLFFVIAANSFGSAQKENRLSLEAVKVKKGETLWKIARKYAPPESDYRRFVSRIMEINNLNRSYLYQDEVIYVPVYLP